MNIPSLEGYAPPTGPYTAGQWFAIAIHHMVAHPLTFFTADARWAWRLHDWAYRTATGDATPSPTRVHTCPHLSVRQKLAAFVHDVVAHPLIFVAGGARWAWVLHDRSGDALMAFDRVPSSLRVGGARAEEAAAVLREHGYLVESCDTDDESAVLVHGFGSGPAAEVLIAHGIPVTTSRHQPASPHQGSEPDDTTRPSMAVVSPEGIDAALAAQEPKCEDCDGTGYPPGDYVPGQGCETCEGSGTAEPAKRAMHHCRGCDEMTYGEEPADGEPRCSRCGGVEPTPTPPGGPSGEATTPAMACPDCASTEVRCDCLKCGEGWFANRKREPLEPDDKDEGTPAPGGPST